MKRLLGVLWCRGGGTIAQLEVQIIKPNSFKRFKLIFLRGVIAKISEYNGISLKQIKVEKKLQFRLYFITRTKCTMG